MSDERFKMSSNKKITAAAIAKEANVSPATVSRVINEKFDMVTEETVQIVHDAMKRLGYIVPESKKIVHKDRPVLICNIPDNNLFYHKVIQGAVASANSHGCHLLFNQAPLDHSNIETFLRMIQRVNAAGVIILNHVPTDLLLQIRALVPLVQCAEFNPEVSFPYVSIDDSKAAKNATEYLIARGRNKIALINGPSSYKYARERRSGYMAALEEAHLNVRKNWIVNLPEINYEMAYSAACQILNSEPVPNAFFAVSDTLAAAVIKAAKRFKYQVPQDIMVVGFDNTSISYMCSPSITTVNQPEFQEGFTSCELLLKMITDPDSEVHSILLETELIIRETT